MVGGAAVGGAKELLFVPEALADWVALPVLAALTFEAAVPLMMFSALGVGLVVQYQTPFASAQACPSLALE